MAIDPAFLNQLKSLNILIKRRVASRHAGGRASLRQGKGIEVVDYAEYFPGDDFRLIDWHLYGRTEKLYIKRFEEEKTMEMHVLLDVVSRVTVVHLFHYPETVDQAYLPGSPA